MNDGNINKNERPVQRLGQSMLLGVFILMGSNIAFADNCEMHGMLMMTFTVQIRFLRVLMQS